MRLTIRVEKRGDGGIDKLTAQMFIARQKKNPARKNLTRVVKAEKKKK